MAGLHIQRSNKTILAFTITACALLCIFGIGSGYYFSSHIVSATKYFLPEAGEQPPVWLPFLVFLAIVILAGWGTLIASFGIMSRLMTGITTGEIIRSEIRTYFDSDEGGDVYFIESTVGYIVDGYRYENEERHAFSSTDRDEAVRKLESIKPGDPVTVIYDPGNPFSMLLNKPDTNPGGEILAGIGFISVGLALSLFLGVILSRLL